MRKLDEAGVRVPHWEKVGGPCNAVLLSHWLELTQEECGLNSKPKVVLKVLTVKGCHFRTLLVAMLKMFS